MNRTSLLSLRNTRMAIAVVLAGLTAGAASAADLTVGAGQTYTVGMAQSDLRLDHLTLGDNARVVFAPGVGSWRVYARQAAIGKGVVIDGRGVAGAGGVNGIDRAEAAKDCEDGRAGGNGGAGAVGAAGVALDLWWGIESLGSLNIQTDGGAGGVGARGGRGQDAGRVNLCAGPRAGDGGIGGVGGSGGKGGSVTFSYSAADKNSTAKAATLAERIRISSAGGVAGVGGIGGVGGTATEGRFQRTPAGDRWFKGGSPGAAGANGASGITGIAGEVQLQLATSTTGPSWLNEITGAAAPTVAALQQQVQVLQANSAVVTSTGENQSVQQLLQQMQRRIDELEQRVKALEHR